MLTAQGLACAEGKEEQHQAGSQTQEPSEQPAFHLVRSGGVTRFDVTQHRFEFGMKFLYNGVGVR